MLLRDPYEVPDEIGDGRPLLVVMSNESTVVPSDLREPPPDVAEMFEFKGNDRKIREFKNNLVFVAAEARLPTTLLSPPRQPTSQSLGRLRAGSATFCNPNSPDYLVSY